jgi:thioester reductase-like protein
VLLTGATGFLGTSLLRSLIDAGLHVTCLVRTTDDSPSARIETSLRKYGLWRDGDERRATAVGGDVTLPHLGLEPAFYDRLAVDLHAVYHAAADVNWVSGYDALRSANVDGTVMLLRFACAGTPKRFHFVSSLSVCYAADLPGSIDERSDMLAHVDRLLLGYAQTKCVAESLVRHAADRGLHAQIYRPALLAGHSISGASNLDDLVARLLKGCIQMGAAPDLDWIFDALPVDTAADAIVRLSRSARAGLDTFHLRHPKPRHWRECVLWANLFGYRVRLEPYAVWLERLLREARTSEHALTRLRGFFTRRISGLTVPEHFEERHHNPVGCTTTRTRERALGLRYPPLDAERLDSFFQDYIRRGFLEPPEAAGRGHVSPGASHASHPAPKAAARTGLVELFEPMLQAHFADEQLRVTRADVVARGSDHSIISELTSWRQRQRAGLFHYSLHLATSGGTRRLDAIAKLKPSDENVLEVAETTAAICDARIERELAAVRDRIGIRGGHVREIEIYRAATDSRFARHLPGCYGTWRHDAENRWGLLLEKLDDMALMDAVDAIDAWSDGHVATAVDGLAALHACWLGRERELGSHAWMGHSLTSASVGDMSPFWAALADHAAPAFRGWAGPRFVRTHARLAASPREWWPGLETVPRTLIHNDFNPRNIGIRRVPDGTRLVAYDWELATIGAPQRDLAELLCFVLPPDVDRRTLNGWIDRHRASLERESGSRLPRTAWTDGFRSALNDVLVSRLAFYALIHRVRPQTFLPRVVATWTRIHALIEAGAPAGRISRLSTPLRPPRASVEGRGQHGSLP